MLKCGITGATGVLGRRIIKQLPYQYYIYKNKVEDYKKLQKWINSKDLDLVLHLAAIVPTNKVNKNFKKAKSVNINGTKNIVKAVLKKSNPPKWFFYASTSHVYPSSNIKKKFSEKDNVKPYSLYGKTKLSGEKIVKKNFKNKKINFCIGRIFSFTDKRQKIPFVIPTMISKIKNTKDVKVNFNNLNHYRDFISTKDIAKAIKILCKNKKTGIYNIGSGREINLKTIAQIIAKKYEKKIIFLNDGKPTYLICNNRKLKKLGWKPIKFKKSLNYFY
tara:strand:+ start:171 stop:995 length:825 start_codon:yes stop_codon:yes gene_type:complete